jgi:hypothetical protein
MATQQVVDLPNVNTNPVDPKTMFPSQTISSMPTSSGSQSNASTTNPNDLTSVLVPPTQTLPSTTISTDVNKPGETPKEVPVVTGKEATDTYNQQVESAKKIQEAVKTQSLTNQQRTALETELKAKQDELAKLQALQTEKDKTVAEPSKDEINIKSYDEAFALFGSDFTGLIQQPDGSFKISRKDYNDKLGIKTLPDGSIDGRTPEQKAADLNRQEVMQRIAESDAKYKETEAKIEGIRNGTIPLESWQQSMLDATKKEFENLKEQQRIANKNYEKGTEILGMRRGQAEYTTSLFQGAIHAAVSAGVAKIADIDSKMALTLSEMEMAYRQDNIDEVDKAWKRYNDYQKEKSAELRDLNDKAVEATKDARNFNYQVYKDELDYTLKSDQFSWQQKMDAIQQALKENEFALEGQKFTEQQKKNLQDYQIEIAKLNQPDYQISGDYIYNKKTGQYSMLPQFSIDGGINADINSAWLNAAENVMMHDQKGKEALINELNRLMPGVNRGDLKSINYAQDKLIIAALGKSDAAKEKAIGINTSINELKILRERILRLQKEGIGTNLISGTIQESMGKLGLNVNPELQEIASQAEAALIKYRKEMTGVAFGPQEAKSYERIMASSFKGTSLNLTLINTMLHSLEEVRDVNLKSKIGETPYNEIFGNAKRVFSSSEEAEAMFNQLGLNYEEYSQQANDYLMSKFPGIEKMQDDKAVFEEMKMEALAIIMPQVGSINRSKYVPFVSQEKKEGGWFSNIFK